MAFFLPPPKHLFLCFFMVFIITITITPAVIESHNIDESSSGFTMSDDALLDWPTTPNTNLLEQVLDEGGFGTEEEGEGEGSKSDGSRRSLFWRRVHYYYYISYGALSANRIPCPPRSGRSYYTHNCFNVRGVAHPYSRGCSKITRCRR